MKTKWNVSNYRRGEDDKLTDEFIEELKEREAGRVKAWKEFCYVGGILLLGGAIFAVGYLFGHHFALANLNIID